MPERPEQSHINKEEFFARLAQAESLPILTADEQSVLREQMTEQDFEKYYNLLRNFKNSETGKLEIEIDQIIKPNILFHASQNGDILEFEPRAEKKRHPDDPAQIFASPSEAVSSFFIVSNDNDTAASGRWGKDRPWTLVIGDPEKFKTLDKGGWIYQLPTDSFTVNPNMGLGLFEWTSIDPVVPTKKVYYDSGLKAMMDLGVRVYSMEPEEFKKFRASEDQRQILDNLEPLSL